MDGFIDEIFKDAHACTLPYTHLPTLPGPTLGTPTRASIFPRNSTQPFIPSKHMLALVTSLPDADGVFFHCIDASRVRQQPAEIKHPEILALDPLGCGVLGAATPRLAAART